MRITILSASLLTALWAPCQDNSIEQTWTSEEGISENYIDSLIDAFEFHHGTVDLAHGVATLQLPDAFKFLEGEHARQLIVEVWENPPSIAEKMLGVVMHADAGPYDGRPAFVVYFDPIGYVSDEDAASTDYDEMMGNMMKEDSAENAQRILDGYSPLELVGWASPPYYDKPRKVMHWAREMRQADDEDHVLNYNIRVLGRRGVLILNGLSTMSKLVEVKAEVPLMLNMISFNDGHLYGQFDPDIDTLADQTLAGLIDGGTRDKVVGLLKLAVKVIAGVFVGMIVLVVLIWYLVVRRKRRRAAAM